MKKIVKGRCSLCFICFLVLAVLLFPTTVYAVSFDDGLNVPLSDDWIESELDNKDVIFHADSAVRSLSLSILSNRTFRSNYINNLKQETKEELDGELDAILQSDMSKRGVFITGGKILEQEQLTFLQIAGYIQPEDEDVQEYFTEFVTIVNGGTLQLTFYKENAPLSEQDLAYSEEIVRGIRYDRITERSIDGNILWKVILIGVVFIFLIVSLIWRLVRIRKRRILMKQQSLE